MRAELKRLHRQLATTTLYVTHDQEEAMTLGDRVVVMKDGLIQQCAPPLEVYESPVNRFVAGFVGTPPMNFLGGRVIRQNGHLYFDEGPEKLRLPERFDRPLAGREDQPIVLGVRPEGMSYTAAGRFSGVENILNVTVTVIEPLGDKTDLYAQTAGNKPVVCRVESDRGLSEGMRLAMHLNMVKVHIFEPGDEGVNVGLKTAGDRASATQLV